MGLRVGQIMTSPVVSIDERKTAYDAAVLMHFRRVGSIVVTRDGNPVGIITERDFVRTAATEKVLPDRVKLSEIMSRDLKTVDPETNVEEAGEIMARYQIRRLPVVQGNKVIGIVTSRDILLKLLEGLGYESVYA